MLQVLGYTLHAVLEGVLREAPTGAVDDSLPLILPMMEVGPWCYLMLSR